MPVRRAFTLIEMMLAVAVIAIILALALPSLLRSKITTNETSAIASLKAMTAAQEQYKATAGGSVFGTITQLSSGSPPYFNLSQFRNAQKDGYSFRLVVGMPADSNWFCRAYPITPGKTGNRRFFVDSTGVIRFKTVYLASSADSAIDWQAEDSNGSGGAGN